MTTKLYILVHFGVQLDFTKFRHRALFCEHHEGPPWKSVLHIQGSQGHYKFEKRDNYNPDASQRVAKKIFVAEVPSLPGRAPVRQVISETQIKHDPLRSDWNCLHWVGDALIRLVGQGHLTVSQRASAIDLMTSACLEAEGDCDM